MCIKQNLKVVENENRNETADNSHKNQKKNYLNWNYLDLTTFRGVSTNLCQFVPKSLKIIFCSV